MTPTSQQSGAEKILAAILKAKKHATPEYGGNVMPAIEMYRRLSTPEERRDYLAALELMLRHDKKDIREYGILLCLGFVVFKDVQ
jgi:hypothetical protein